MDGKVDQAFIDGLSVSRVALDFMNTVHREELDLVRKLLVALQADDKTAASPLLAEWLQHTHEHFAREERLMAEHDFPPYPVHKSEHDRVFATMQACAQAWQESPDAARVIDYIVDEWWPWLQRHIASMDMVTANYLSQMNLDVDL
jgi:hemerythrin